MKICTREFFESAHRLVDYDENCKRIHGHNFVVDVEVLSAPSDLTKTGFVMDFKDIKKLTKEFDHKLLLKECKENRELFTEKMPKDWIVWLPFNPTCENMSLYFKQCLLKTINKESQKYMVTVKVYETYKPEKKSYAEA